MYDVTQHRIAGHPLYTTMASGTQSPPLEATGSHIPMGVSSIDGTCSRPMKDIEQRARRSHRVLVGRVYLILFIPTEYFSDAVRRNLAI